MGKMNNCPRQILDTEKVSQNLPMRISVRLKGLRIGLFNFKSIVLVGGLVGFVLKLKNYFIAGLWRRWTAGQPGLPPVPTRPVCPVLAPQAGRRICTDRPRGRD